MGRASERSYIIPAWVRDAPNWRRIRVPNVPCTEVGLVTVDLDRFFAASSESVGDYLERVDYWVGSDRPIVQWRVSASRTGVHLRLPIPNPHLWTARDVLALREGLGDDPYRLKCDAWRFARTRDPIYLRGVLWDAKFDTVTGLESRAGRWHVLA